MTTKVRKLLDIHALNFQSRHYAKTAVLKPFETPAAIVEKVYEQKATILADRTLAPLGKVRAQADAGKAAAEQIAKWHAPLLAGLNADIAAQRAALQPKAAKPSDSAVDFMARQLRQFTALERATFYNSATDDERLVMEAASVAIG